MSNSLKDQYKAFCEWCYENPSFDLDPRLHQHSGPIEHGGYIAHTKTATAFAAWKAALEQQPASVAQKPVGYFVKRSEFGPWIEVQQETEQNAIPLYTAPAVSAGWISVSERLPDHSDSVQVWCSGAECAGVAWMRQGAWYMPEPQAIGYDTITHWQPLAGKPVDAPAAPVAQEPGEDWDGEVYIGSRTPKFSAPPAAEQPDTVAVPRPTVQGAIALIEAHVPFPTAAVHELRELLTGGVK